METTRGSKLMADRVLDPSQTDPLAFSRAEWIPQGALFAWFRRPNYFPELETPTPCVLVGGRGTGKTTVLRCLSYQGRAALSGGQSGGAATWPYYGLYHRVNSNRVRAFKGAGLSESEWTPLFAHYVNLLLAGQLIDFIIWYETTEGRPLVFAPEFFDDAAAALHLPKVFSLAEMRRELGRSLRDFEGYLNDLQADARPRISIQGGPIDLLTATVAEHPAFKGKHFFFIIDEFENLVDYQQVVFNTLMKHSTSDYSFKIGVRELGWRVKHTSNLDETLSSPADYALIDISKSFVGDSFSAFASEVCSIRMGRDVTKLLPGLTLEQEAERLGIRLLTDPLRRQYVGAFSDVVQQVEALELYFLEQWAATSDQTLEQVLRERARRPAFWLQRYRNYAYSLLFSIRRGRPGLRKYYAGWKTLCLMANGNIRFLLELVFQAKSLHLKAGQREEASISPEHQTEAAIAIGRKYVEELPGSSVLGGQITKLLLGLGRVFEVMAASPQGHAPEVNQFHIEDNDSLSGFGEVLDAAVMNLALVRSTANKRSSSTPEPKDFDYQIHPIYSAFFGFSHRRKRKMRVYSGQLKALIDAPQSGIAELIGKSHRSQIDALPTQLKLFSGFYGGI